MSLITDRAIKTLWERAQAQSSDERASANLWGQLWNTYLFTEMEWSVSQGYPRRVDRIIEYVDGYRTFAVLAFHKATASNAEPRKVEEAEHQAFDACISYLRERPELQFVYAWTSVGTKGMAWKCDRGNTSLTPLFGSKDWNDRAQYVELHSPEAQLIRQAVQMMKTVRPCM